MPRQARVDIAGFHYVTNRADGEKKIFKNGEDVAEFLSIVCRSCERYEAKISAYVVTGSAYHLIVRTSKPNLSLLMRQISSAYSIYFNKMGKRRGSIWRDRFASWVIREKKDLHFIHRYIALIPETEKIVNNYKEYKFSFINTIFSKKINLDCFEKILKKKKLEGLLAETYGEDDRVHLRQFKRTANEGIKKEEKHVEREPLESILKKVKNREKRDKKIKKAFTAGYTQNEIARYLELSQSSISKIVNDIRKA